MAIVYRRVFYAKAGAADPLVAALQQWYDALQKAGLPARSQRLLTDYQSGRSDRVVGEVEIESLGQLEELFSQLAANPTARQAHDELQERVFQLAEYSEGEFWTIR